MIPILETNNLSKHYKDFSLSEVSLSLEPGFIMGLIGPNGAGKTTLLKLLLNLIKRDGGTIKIFGKELLTNEKEIKERTGFVFDEPPWYQMLTISEMSGIISRIYQNWDKNKFEKYLVQFDIDPAKKIDTLSKGMKMKFSIAVALSHNAEFIIMDEPTSGLDPVFRSEILEIIQGLITEENKSVLFSSHITTDLEKVADYISFINDGKLMFSESKEELNDRYCMVKGGSELLDSDTKYFFGPVLRKNSYFTALSEKQEEIKHNFNRLIRDGKLIIEKPSLEDIMLLTVKGGHNV